jgi:hypothetical protein
MANKPPSYDIRPTTIAKVASLFDRFHPYKSTGRLSVYTFGVFENDEVIAAFIWQPPPPGSARSVFEALPQGVLSLSRMVAVPKHERRLNHISKPLRHQMKHLIDRTRWPVLITYSDESVGHTGHVYMCSGWQKTVRRRAPTLTTGEGRRVSRYSNGKSAHHEDVTKGHAWLQRWEHWIAGSRDDVKPAMDLFGTSWAKIPIAGKTWRSGAQAYTYARRAA